jgi:hypothetical protein
MAGTDDNTDDYFDLLHVEVLTFSKITACCT